MENISIQLHLTADAFSQMRLKVLLGDVDFPITSILGEEVGHMLD
jgi:hypothetical protein